MASRTLSRRRFLISSAGAAAVVAVPSLLTVPSAAARSTDRLRVTVNGLRMRTGPGTGYGVVTSLNKGAVVINLFVPPVKANGYTWLKVALDASEPVGWVASEFLGPVDQGWPIGSMAHVAVSRANLRSGPSLSAGVITTVGQGTTGTIVDGPSSGSGHTWYKLNFGNAQGWMSTTVLAPGGGSDRSYVKVASGPLNVRQNPGLGGAIITSVPTGARGYTTTSMPQEADGYVWVNVQFDSGVRGWVAKNFLVWI
jgi:N-acetylmuramoyl-L-alanine amidase